MRAGPLPEDSNPAFSEMLDVLATVRRLTLAGQQALPYVLARFGPGQAPVAVLAEEPRAELRRLENLYGRAVTAVHVAARPAPGGRWLAVRDLHGGRRLEQFCREMPGGGFEALPYCWSEAGPSWSSASSAYHRTSGLMAYCGSRSSHDPHLGTLHNL